jgi:hypothetical protein
LSDHYQHGDIECIDALRSALGPEGFRGFCSGNVIKYVWRYRRKVKEAPAADLEKARDYLNWLIDDIA